MINIKNFFINHFASTQISDNRIKAFALDHINKLTAWLTIHTDAELSALLNALMTKYNAYFGAINDEASKFSIQLSLTLAADNAWSTVLDFIRQQEGTVRGIWGKDSPEYLQFYPHGLEEYNRATKLTKDTLLSRYLTIATGYSADLPADFVTDFTALKSDWSTKFAAQQNQIGLVHDADSQVNSSRTPIEQQLSLNMLIIASKNIGYPSRVTDFFNQTLINRKKPQPLPATSVVIRGKVLNASTENPMEGATVTLTKIGQMEPVGEKEIGVSGRFSFRMDNMQPSQAGVYRLTFEAPGFQTLEKEQNVELGQEYTVNVVLAEGTMLKVA